MTPRPNHQRPRRNNAVQDKLTFVKLSDPTSFGYVLTGSNNGKEIAKFSGAGRRVDARNAAMRALRIKSFQGDRAIGRPDLIVEGL